VERLIASFFGLGLALGRIRGSDVGSGTVGAMAALVAAWLIGIRWGWMAVMAVGVALIAIGTWAVARVFESSGDAGWIVVDEAAGAFVALIGLTALPAIAVAFVVFRVGDIFKGLMPGVRQAERLPGATGVMADDVVAGLYGLAAGHLLQAII
jgi:phosphatidylglycerophosphatase A